MYLQNSIVIIHFHLRVFFAHINGFYAPTDTTVHYIDRRCREPLVGELENDAASAAANKPCTCGTTVTDTKERIKGDVNVDIVIEDGD